MKKARIQSDALHRERRVAVQWLITASVGMFPMLFGLCLFTGNDPVPVLLASAASTAVGYLFGKIDEDLARIGSALSIVSQSLLTVAAFAGHPWQMDAHLMIIAALIASALLLDPRAMLFPCAMIVLHHLASAVFFPAIAFDSLDLLQQLERVILHTGAVVVSGSVLYLKIQRRLQVDAEAQDAWCRAETAAGEARNAEAAAIAARDAAEKEREVAIKAQAASDAAVQSQRQETSARLVAEDEARSQEQQARDAEERERIIKDQAISAIRGVLHELARGNLRVRLEQDMSEEFEDLRTAFNSAVSSLEAAFDDIHANTGLIRRETADITESATELSRRTEAQAATLEGLAATMEQLSSLIGSAARDAKEAENAVQSTRSDAEVSSDIMARAMSAMSAIESTSDEVRKTTSIIDDIAFQTTLLALNAGVEAARAGAAGRGFAVVAAEVRALARRSSEAASRISLLIGQSGEQIRDGVALVHETSGALEQIILSVTGASDRMAQITATSVSQADGVRQVNTSLQDLDIVAQKNAAMFEETTTACQTLTGSAEALSKSLERFSLTDSGLTGASRVPPRVA